MPDNKKYRVHVVETWNYTYEVEAGNESEAVATVRQTCHPCDAVSEAFEDLLVERVDEVSE